VRARHSHEIDGLTIFAECALTITLVVAETILHTDNDPRQRSEGAEGRARTKDIYHKFVKTTPKPRATKNRRGELVGPLPPLDEPVVVAAGSAVDVVADI
jgi:hypothetical protein